MIACASMSMLPATVPETVCPVSASSGKLPKYQHESCNAPCYTWDDTTASPVVTCSKRDRCLAQLFCPMCLVTLQGASSSSFGLHKNCCTQASWVCSGIPLLSGKVEHSFSQCIAFIFCNTHLFQAITCALGFIPVPKVPVGIRPTTYIAVLFGTC